MSRGQRTPVRHFLTGQSTGSFATGVTLPFIACGRPSNRYTREVGLVTCRKCRMHADFIAASREEVRHG